MVCVREREREKKERKRKRQFPKIEKRHKTVKSVILVSP